MRDRASSRRLAPWATLTALVLLGGGAATASALSATAGAPVAHVSVPRGWKPVTYGGLTISVPGSWGVFQRNTAGCGIPGPGVLVGPPYTGPLRLCAYSAQRGPVAIFGGPDFVAPVGPEHSTLINGIEALVSKSTMQDGLRNNVPQYQTEEVVRLPGDTVWLDITVPGTASAPSWAVVNEVVATVRPS